MEAYKERLVTEYQELTERIDKLARYLEQRSEELSDPEAELTDEAFEYFCLMFLQLMHMSRYAACLRKRAFILKITLER